MKRIFDIGDFQLHYEDDVDGGGTSIGLDFKNILNTHYAHREFKCCLEWCSGPGFIGFDLLLNNYCKELTLVDQHQSALNFATHSLSCYNTNLNVTTYCTDKISSLPITKKFDLVVANPPHFSKPVNYQEIVLRNDPRIYLDLDWVIFKEFFNNISKHLTPDGVILLQESSWGCNRDTFDKFLVNLQRTNCYQTNSPVNDYPIFYIEYKLQ